MPRSSRYAARFRTHAAARSHTAFSRSSGPTSLQHFRLPFQVPLDCAKDNGKPSYGMSIGTFKHGWTGNQQRASSLLTVGKSQGAPVPTVLFPLVSFVRQSVIALSGSCATLLHCVLLRVDAA